MSLPSGHAPSARTNAAPVPAESAGTARRRIADRLAALRTRQGLIPVCGWCRKVRDPAGAWGAVEPGVLEGAGTALTHGVCPDCARKLLGRRHEAA